MSDPGLNRDVITVITEPALIKHFFDKRKYDEQVMVRDFQGVSTVKEKLRARGYTALRVDLVPDGVMGYLGTRKTDFHNKHASVIC